jgi:hypothetical protein
MQHAGVATVFGKKGKTEPHIEWNGNLPSVFAASSTLYLLVPGFLIDAPE